MTDLDDLVAEALASLGEGPMTWDEHNRVAFHSSLLLYGAVKVCTACRGVLDYPSGHHYCQAGQR